MKYFVLQNISIFFVKKESLGDINQRKYSIPNFRYHGPAFQVNFRLFRMLDNIQRILNQEYSSWRKIVSEVWVRDY